MKLLAIDTSTEACSVALYIEGEISASHEIVPRRHAELVLDMCQGLLDEAGITLKDLDALGFGRGPGAFTGVRIATGVVQGIAWAAGLPVVPVSSLAAVALHAMQQYACENVAVAMDARMNEVYWGCYNRQGAGIVNVSEETLVAPADVSLPDGRWFAAGTGWKSYADILASNTGNSVYETVVDIYPYASAVAQLAVNAFINGEQVRAEQAIPVYLRDRVAEKSV